MLIRCIHLQPQTAKQVDMKSMFISPRRTRRRASRCSTTRTCQIRHLGASIKKKKKSITSAWPAGRTAGRILPSQSPGFSRHALHRQKKPARALDRRQHGRFAIDLSRGRTCPGAGTVTRLPAFGAMLAALSRLESQRPHANIHSRRLPLVRYRTGGRVWVHRSICM